jgi:hypothetical protein
MSATDSATPKFKFPFRVQYTDKVTGELRTEEPQYRITFDLCEMEGHAEDCQCGEHYHALMLNNIIIASIPLSSPVESLWRQARQNLNTKISTVQ